MLKRPHQFLMITFSLLGVLVLLLSGCGPTGTPANSGSNAKPVRGGTWIDDIPNEPNSLIPNSGSSTFNVLVDQALFAPLFYGDKDGHINPGIVSEMPTLANKDISADLKTWTFKLKPGLKWSDGQPLNADDIDYAWKLYNDKNFPTYTTVGFNLIQSADVSADKLAITFHLSQPFAPFIAIWTDAQATPLPKHVYSKYTPDALAKSHENLSPSVVSGPFMMSESRPGDRYTVVRNPNYYRADEGLPYLDKIIFVPVRDENTILKNLQTSSITSSWFLDVSKMPAYRALTNYNLSINPVTVNFEMIAINFRNPILGQNREVRQAMAMAIDYASLIKTARLGTAVPLCIPHGKGFNPGYQADAPCPKFDPAAANRLLDQNGWVKGADGVRAKNGQRLEFNYSTTTGKPWREQDELIIQANFKNIGIKLDTQNVPADTFFGTFLPGGKHDLAEYEQTPIYDPDESTVVATDQIPGASGGGGNYSFYSNKQVDQYLTLEKSTADPVQRQDAFNHLHQIYLTDFPIIVLYGPTDPGIAKFTAHNYTPGPEAASETVNVWEWYCSDGKC